MSANNQNANKNNVIILVLSRKPKIRKECWDKSKAKLKKCAKSKSKFKKQPSNLLVVSTKLTRLPPARLTYRKCH
jgi:hypothetical protein